MTRSRATAKKAGTSWESQIVDTLIEHGWPHAERRRLAGAADKGDIAGIPGLVIEAKNTRQVNLASAVSEARTEQVNAGALFGVAWLKRRGRVSAADGYVVMDGHTFMQLLKEAGF